MLANRRDKTWESWENVVHHRMKLSVS